MENQKNVEDQKVQKTKKEPEKFIHTLWHSFKKYLAKYYYILQPRLKIKIINGETEIVSTKRMYRDEVDFDQVTGIMATTRINKFVEDNPDIRIVSCDDNVHAGSNLYLIRQ